MGYSRYIPLLALPPVAFWYIEDKPLNNPHSVKKSAPNFSLETLHEITPIEERVDQAVQTALKPLENIPLPTVKPLENIPLPTVKPLENIPAPTLQERYIEPLSTPENKTSEMSDENIFLRDFCSVGVGIFAWFFTDDYSPKARITFAALSVLVTELAITYIPINRQS